MLAPSSSEDEDDSQGYVSHGDRGDTTSLASTITDRGYPGQSGDLRSLQLPPISSVASIRSLLTPASEPTRGATAVPVRPLRYVS